MKVDYKYTFVYRLAIVLLCIYVQGCIHSVKPIVPETFCEKLQRTERISCADLTYHDYEDILPAPDAERMFQAWDRGREDFARINPAARNVKMGDVAWLRPKLAWFDGKPYPLLADDARHPRAYTWITPYLLIAYSYEETIEHEAHHAIGYLLMGSQARTADAIAAGMGGYSEADVSGLGFFPVWFIFCHGTIDDPFGEPGNVASCAWPYRGPINPSMVLLPAP